MPLSEKFRPSPKSSAGGGSSLPLILRVIGLLTLITAFILTFLCLFAGHNKSFLKDYPVFSLNTSRLGQNWLVELEQKISDVDINLNDLRRRNSPVDLRDALAVPTPVAAAPSTLITVAPRLRERQVASLFDEATDNAGELLDSAQSKIEVQASSLQSAVAAEASAIIDEAKDMVMETVNNAYEEIVSQLELHGFYSVFVAASCAGTYQFPNGTNITFGEVSPPPPDNSSVTRILDTCEKNSALDPMQFIRILYWIGVACLVLALIFATLALVQRPRRIWPMAAVIFTLLAFCVVGLASAATHGVSLAASKVVNFVGREVGISATMGNHFLGLTWATSALLLVGTVVLMASAVMGGDEGQRGGRHGNKEGKGYEMRDRN